MNELNDTLKQLNIFLDEESLNKLYKSSSSLDGAIEYYFNNTHLYNILAQEKVNLIQEKVNLIQEKVNLIQEKVSHRHRIKEIINQCEENIKINNHDDLFTKINYIYDAGNLEIRKIDLLLFASTLQRDNPEFDYISIIVLLEYISDDILLKIFNDNTLIYPHNNRPFLTNKLGSTMSTLLIQGYFEIYYYIINRLQNRLELNVEDDLMILFNFILFRLSDSRKDETIVLRYKPLINILKLKLNLTINLFSNEWFDNFINKCKETLNNLKQKESWIKNNYEEKSKSSPSGQGCSASLNLFQGVLLIQFLKRDTQLSYIFTGHSRWEDTVEPVIESVEPYSNYILDRNLDVDEEYINSIREIFN